MLSATSTGGGTLATTLNGPKHHAHPSTIFVPRSAAIMGEYMAMGTYVSVRWGSVAG
jgi:hypothetical protein